MNQKGIFLGAWIASFAGAVACSSSSNSGGTTDAASPGNSDAAAEGGATGDSGTASDGASQDGGFVKTGTWYYCSYASSSACAGNSGITMATAQSACSTAGGMLVASCPTTDLLGCCFTVPITGREHEDCFYSSSGATLASAQNACNQQHGTWSSTP